MELKNINELLNSDNDVRRRAASNSNTPAEVLTKLAEDSAWVVRSSAASNPNTPGYVDNRAFLITESYVATQGTSNLWYKFNAEKPFYTCGCFVGNREQLIGKITFDGGVCWNERIMILDILDKKFDETFNKKSNDKARTNT